MDCLASRMQKIMEDKAIQAWLSENSIQEIETIVPDMAGTARGKLIPIEKFTSGSVIRLPESVFTQSVTGKFLPDGYINPADRDILIRPDLSTLKILPWMKDPTATVINDCFYEDGSNVDISPRQVLRNVINLYKELGLKPIVAPELEFYLIQRNTDPNQSIETPIGRSGRQETVRRPFSLDALDEFEPIIDQINAYANAMDIKIDTLEHEMGTAQLEINFQHDDPLKICDQVMIFKRLIREAAMQHGIYATFLAKPIEDQPGSAMHWHISLVDNDSGENVFSKGEGETEIFKSFIAGLQQFTSESILFNAPYVNSYRRFQRFQNAPINLCWGYDNRTTGLRVPTSSSKNKRVEFRVGGADVNPYLSIASSLACAYLGIQKSLQPSAPEESNASNMQFNLPKNLSTAIDVLRASESMPALMGNRFLQIYVAMKEDEYNEYFQVISPWERENLLLSV